MAANADALPGRVQSLDNELQERLRDLSANVQAISTLDQELRLLEAELRLGSQRPPTAARDRDQVTELEAELAAKSGTYSSEHPEIRRLTSQIAAYKEQSARNSESTAASATLTPELALVAERITIGKQRHEELMARKAETAERIAALRTMIANVPGVESRRDAIERERQSMQQALDEMNGRLATAKISERLERDDATAHVQIIEQPETPLYPTSPNRTKLLVLALAGSFGCGLAGLYLSDSMQRSIRGAFDLENVLAGSTLVMIPHWSAEGERRSFVNAALDRIAGVRARRPPVPT